LKRLSRRRVHARLTYSSTSRTHVAMSNETKREDEPCSLFGPAESQTDIVLCVVTVADEP